MNTAAEKRIRRERRHKRIRARIKGTAEQPRLAVYRSNTALSAQLIDDERGVTLLSTHSTGKKGEKDDAFAVGKMLAGEAKGKGITTVVFDRGGVLYAGRVKAFAQGARDGGLIF